jgi:hypothetical protein
MDADVDVEREPLVGVRIRKFFRRWGFHEGTVDAAPRGGATTFTIAWDDGTRGPLAPDAVCAAVALARRHHSASPPPPRGGAAAALHPDGGGGAAARNNDNGNDNDGGDDVDE